MLLKRTATRSKLLPAACLLRVHTYKDQPMSIIRLFTRFAASAFLLSSPALMGEDIGTGTNGPSVETTEIQPSQSGLEPWNVEWFGHFNAEIFETTGWIWHFEHGWVYPLESEWAYLNDHGWV